jgi:hypothetical protein
LFAHFVCLFEKKKDTHFVCLFERAHASRHHPVAKNSGGEHHSSYGWLRLPPTARVLALEWVAGVRLQRTDARTSLNRRKGHPFCSPEEKDTHFVCLFERAHASRHHPVAKNSGGEHHSSYGWLRLPPTARVLALEWVAGVRLQRTDARTSLVNTYSRYQARHGLGPRGVPVPLARA